MGIVYTPQPIVDWMCVSVQRTLQTQWGKSLATPGVKILDPCTGTGNFVVNLMGRISTVDFARQIQRRFVGQRDHAAALYHRFGQHRTHVFRENRRR